MKELDIIGKNISRLRAEQQLTQEDLSGMAEIDRGFISNLENSRANCLHQNTRHNCKLPECYVP